MELDHTPDAANLVLVTFDYGRDLLRVELGDVVSFVLALIDAGKSHALVNHAHWP